MAKLATYHQKRDFKQTREPKGRVERTDRHRFVIQRHDATRLHYDLRLELDGVYKSWAVTKTPSLDPAVRRLAVEVEDHPIEYGTFEGTIPEGQYGGGTVQLWDRGSWQSQTGNASRDLAQGHLKFVMDGERMKGKWALVRMRDDASRPGKKTRHNWLLVKEVDDEAHRGKEGDALTKEVTSVKSGRTLDEIASKSRKVWNSNRPLKENVAALKKPAKKAVAKSSKRPAVKKKDRDKAQTRVTRMPDFVAPQLARLMRDPPSGANWVHEVKFDGYRMQMRVENGTVRLHSRKGLDWTERFPEIAKEGRALPDCMIDGEICALNPEGSSDFGRLQTALTDHKTGALIYYVFDCLFAGGIDLRGQPLSTRKEALQEVLKPIAKSRRILFVPHFESSGNAMLSAACKMDLEGVISKPLDGPYVSGRNGGWTKSKCRGGQEAVIGAWRGGPGKFRSLMVGTYQNGKLRYMGRVGTGYNAKTAADLLKRLKPLKRATSPFVDRPPHVADINWVEPKLVAEIEFENVTADGLFRQAAFKGLRLDKPAASVVREVPADAPKEKTMAAKPAAKPKAKTASKSGDIVLGIRISHPDKELWPKSKFGPAVTKIGLARYMAMVAERMLPHVANRPISIVRAPDGINGQHFFQRHVLKGTAAPMLAIKARGEKEPYLGIDTAEALVALAQQAATEIHPWGSKPGDPDSPERIIIDLDPAPDLKFSAVIDGAKELKRRLEKLGFTPFVKTTGGKGLHVVFAIKNANWPQTKAFAKAIAQQLERDMPDRYTTTIAKKARTGKIFVD